MFWRLALATCWRLILVAKNACSAFRRQFLKLFQFFPRIFVTIHCLPLYSLNWNWPKPSSNSIYASFLLKSSKKGMSFLCLISFSMFWVCFSCFYECIGVIMILSNVILIQGFALSWWLFIVWELVFLTLLLMFVCCLGSVHCFMIVVISFISCLWYSITLFVIWILVMLSGHLILRYWCSSP